VCIQRLELDWEVAAAQQYTIELLLQKNPALAPLNGQSSSAADASAAGDATAAASAAAAATAESEQWFPIYSTSSGRTRETSPKHVLHSIEQDELVRFTAAALAAMAAAPSPSSMTSAAAAAAAPSPSPSLALAVDSTRGGLPCGTALRLTVQRNGTPWGSSLWQVRVFGWAA
jgi:hypothetical protein